MSAAVCAAEFMDGYRMRRCSRPVKSDGLCAQHLAGAKRSEANEAKHAAKRQESDAAKAAVIDYLGRVGLSGKPYYETSFTGGMGGYLRSAVVTLEELDRWRLAQK